MIFLARVTYENTSKVRMTNNLHDLPAVDVHFGCCIHTCICITFVVILLLLGLIPSLICFLRCSLQNPTYAQLSTYCLHNHVLHWSLNFILITTELPIDFDLFLWRLICIDLRTRNQCLFVLEKLTTMTFDILLA